MTPRPRAPRLTFAAATPLLTGKGPRGLEPPRCAGALLSAILRKGKNTAAGSLKNPTPKTLNSADRPPCLTADFSPPSRVSRSLRKDVGAGSLQNENAMGPDLFAAASWRRLPREKSTAVAADLHPRLPS
eukprot:2709122-Pyramimonas_sp.AAC.1